VEYKSPGSHVSVTGFYKVYGYACLYASLNGVSIHEITITFDPVNLFRGKRRTLTLLMAGLPADPPFFTARQNLDIVEFLLSHFLIQKGNRGKTGQVWKNVGFLKKSADRRFCVIANCGNSDNVPNSRNVMRNTG
jgi:hypothetical protein